MKDKLYPVTECKNVIYNIFTEPKYTELDITKRAYIKLMCYINLIGAYEISGFGRIQDGTITDFKIIKQTVRSAYVECNEDSVLDFIRSIPREQLSEWELDWHSHVEMGAFPSGTDNTNYESMLKLRGYKQFPVMIANKRQEFHLVNYIASNNTPDITLHILDEPITKEEIDEIYNEVKYDIQLNCTKYVAPVTVTKNYTTKKYNEYIVERPTSRNYYYCDCCGTELLTKHELAVGLCEDCEIAIAETEGESKNDKL